jgi:hypothetical protein
VGCWCSVEAAPHTFMHLRTVFVVDISSDDVPSSHIGFTSIVAGAPFF